MKPNVKLLLKSLEHIINKESDKFKGFKEEQLNGVGVSFDEKHSAMGSGILFEWKFHFKSMITPDVVHVFCNESGCCSSEFSLDF